MDFCETHLPCKKTIGYIYAPCVCICKVDNLELIRIYRNIAHIIYTVIDLEFILKKESIKRFKINGIDFCARFLIYSSFTFRRQMKTNERMLQEKVLKKYAKVN